MAPNAPAGRRHAARLVLLANIGGHGIPTGSNCATPLGTARLRSAPLAASLTPRERARATLSDGPIDGLRGEGNEGEEQTTWCCC